MLNNKIGPKGGCSNLTQKGKYNSQWLNRGNRIEEGTLKVMRVGIRYRERGRKKGFQREKKKHGKEYLLVAGDLQQGGLLREYGG